MWLESIVPAILQNVVKISPIRAICIRPYQQGVKYTLGKDVNLYHYDTGIPFPENGWKIWCWSRTGLHFFIGWGIQDIDIEDTAEIVVDSDVQTISTKDHKNLSVSTSIRYSICDARKLQKTIQDYNDSILNLIEGFLSDSINAQNIDYVLKNKKEIEQHALSESSGQLMRWGVDLKDIKIINMCESFSIRMIE